MVRILIIDDEAQTRSMLRDVLERAGYEVVEASNGREGLQRYHEAPVALVITDLLMPEQEGLETIRTLRQVSPDAKILAISGGGRTGGLDFLEIAKILGAQRTLSKPFPRQALLAAIRDLVPDPDEGTPTTS